MFCTKKKKKEKKVIQQFKASTNCTRVQFYSFFTFLVEW